MAFRSIFMDEADRLETEQPSTAEFREEQLDSLTGAPLRFGAGALVGASRDPLVGAVMDYNPTQSPAARCRLLHGDRASAADRVHRGSLRRGSHGGQWWTGPGVR